METQFNTLTNFILAQQKQDEQLSLSFSGENSQFIRFNQSKVRQTGLVNDADLSITIYYNCRTCSTGFTLSGNPEKDQAQSLYTLNKLRDEVVQLPEDPFIVLPKDTGSSNNVHTGDLLSEAEAVDALVPAMQGVDLAGIWASGTVYRGNANSTGQRHWFSTDNFSLDYSLITSDEKMVKATFADANWNQKNYETFMQNSRTKLEFMKRDAIKIKPGEYRTYIASPGVKDILDMFSWNGISEASIRQGQSAFEKMRNENVKLSSCFSISEDFRSGSVPRFNDNGEIAPDVLNLIDNGLLKNTLVSSRSAKEYGIETNYASNGEGIRSPYMATGGLAETDVLQKIGTGLYLGNLHYLNWSDTTGGRITGMTRYACFWVEDGEIVAPIENMRFDDSLYNFFGDNLEDASNETHFNPEVETYYSRSLGGTHCPGILLSSFSLTL